MLRALLRVFVFVAAIAPAGAADSIKFVDSWSFAGPTSFFVLADRNGYFADENLDVSLNRGYGSGAVPVYLASGTFQIGSGDINSMLCLTQKTRIIASLR